MSGGRKFRQRQLLEPRGQERYRRTDWLAPAFVIWVVLVASAWLAWGAR